MLSRFLRLSCLLSLVFLFLGTGALVSDQEVQASGAVNWKTTVKNPTKYQVRVGLWDLFGKNLSGGYIYIQPGGSTTMETGANCPAMLFGNIQDGSNWRALMSCDCLGTCYSSENPATLYATCCWDITFKICQKAGQGFSEVRPFDYGFCKD
jgi:hypothetical protein